MKTRTQTVALFALAALTSFAPLASAAITGVTGATTWLGSPPVACGLGQLVGVTAFAWDEQQNKTLTIPVDMTNNPGNSSGPIPGVIAGVFDSHFIHFDASAGVNVVGSVSFNNPIIGVIFRNTTLDNSDAPCGSFTTVYPTGYPFRGLGGNSFFSINANTISFSLAPFAAAGQIDQIRVLTHSTPAPGSMALLGMAGIGCCRRRRR